MAEKFDLELEFPLPWRKRKALIAARITRDGCWIPRRLRPNQQGYVRVRTPHGQRGLHRVAYEQLRGPVDQQLDLDHLCRVRRCFNPWHLEPVTAMENIMRGEGIARGYAAQDSCVYGHPFTGDNLYIDTVGQRVCRTCRRARGNSWYHRHKDIVLARRRERREAAYGL